MGDFITAGIGFLGVLVGAGVGFFGIRWQHNAQQLQDIRAKGAELLFLGDQYREECDKPVFISGRRLSDPPLPPSAQQVCRDQMMAIVRYLELVADQKVFTLASSFREAAENLDGVGLAVAGRQKVQERYEDAQMKLKTALKARSRR